jgi:hypothetical protein
VGNHSMFNSNDEKLSGRRARDEIMVRSLRDELIGPAPYGDELDCSGEIVFARAEDAAHKWVQKYKGDEILKDAPLNRYGVGVLYPAGALFESIDTADETGEVPLDENEGEPGSEAPEVLPETKGSGESDDDDFDISTANARFPSSMAVSFFADLSQTCTLNVHISGGVYTKKEVSVAGTKRSWWLREALDISLDISTEDISSTGGSFNRELAQNDLLTTRGIDLRLIGYVRPLNLKNQMDGLLVTLALINRSEDTDFSQRSSRCVFQSGFSVTATDPAGQPLVMPYPVADTNKPDEELEGNSLLYRNDQVFAVGHGCAADWGAAPGEGKNRVSEVSATSLPDYEVPSITPDIKMENGEVLAVSMGALAFYEAGSEGDQQLGLIISEYKKWITSQSAKVKDLGNEALKTAARRHLGICEQALGRMKTGKALLDSDDDAKKAFQLANRAMLLQQKHAPKILRLPVMSEFGAVESFSPDFCENNGGGNWRAFQIGFILMTLSSVVDEQDPLHEAVELIWFPTGGGKTEAYLGLAAFNMIYHRLTRGDDAEGCQVLMRYTLRLLTAQQLQRAATLICAMESLRMENTGLGDRPFSVGLWVGGASTPNKRQHALTKLSQLKKASASNPFLLTRCPWCGAQMGPLDNNGRNRHILGYKKIDNTVRYACPDRGCKFSNRLPVVVIDEDIYENPPSLIIGTVDKFASLPWNPNIRSIFGIGRDGSRERKPPSLIIQDELHLISGPLGSMVSLYEPLVEALCTDRRHGRIIRPKIIGATATTSRYREQIKKLYGRSNAELFPPPGLDAGDSFFARYATDDSKQLLPGRRYIGVSAPGLSSMMTTQVRTFSALLAATGELKIENRDPWQTLLTFYNSLRELGGGLTLFQSDIPSYLNQIRKRLPDYTPVRHINRVEELTSRLSAEDIPLAIDKLMVAHPKLSDEIQTMARRDAKECAINILKDTPDDPELQALLDQISDPSQPQSLEQLNILYRLIGKFKQHGKPLSEAMRTALTAIRGSGVTDACLASNIIEVGVDIDRLGMMAIVGQPKTTAQYIQVSGRVGRQWWESPGLVVTLYSTAKPRDRSHFEHFRGYHQQLYAQVEPASVTPWSDPAIERALHGLLFGYVRQFCPIEFTPDQVPESVFDECWATFIGTRGQFMTETEAERAEKRFKKIIRNWKQRNPRRWGDYFKHVDGEDLMYQMGQKVASNYKKTTFAVPNSMRSVDGESRLEIYNPYGANNGED